MSKYARVILPDFVLGEWQPIRALPVSAGSSFSLWLAQHTQTNQLSAVRQYEKNISPDTLREITQRATHFIGRSLHPVFPMLLAVDIFDERLCLFYEYIEAPSLIERWPLPKRQSEDSAARIALHLVSALHSMYGAASFLPQCSDEPYREASVAQGPIHGKVLPSNISLDRAGRIRLLHLGQLVSPAAQPSLNRKKELCFFAPELIATGTADHRADIYAVGALLGSMLSGAAPSQDLRALEAVQPSRAMLDIIVKAMSLDPDERYQRPKDMLVALVSFLGVRSARLLDLLPGEALDYIADSFHRSSVPASSESLLSLSGLRSAELLPTAQLLSVRPDLCADAQFCEAAWLLLRDNLQAALHRGSLSESEWAIVSLLPSSFLLLREALRTHQRPRMRAHAAQLMGLLNHPSSEESLARALNDPEPMVRSAAVQGLSLLSRACPITIGKQEGEVRVVSCPRPWETMLASINDLERLCANCHTNVVRVTALNDLQCIVGKGCAMYEPLGWLEARTSMQHLYQMKEAPPAMPAPLLTSDQGHLMGGPPRVSERLTTWQRIKKMFTRTPD